MMFTYIFDLLLVGMAALMLLKGHFGITRQMALAPLAVALLDATCAAQITLSLTPVLSGALMVLQLVILIGSGLILRRDRVLARNKQERRRRRREIARTRAAFEQAAARRTAPARRSSVCA